MFSSWDEWNHLTVDAWRTLDGGYIRWRWRSIVAVTLMTRSFATFSNSVWAVLSSSSSVFSIIKFIRKALISTANFFALTKLMQLSHFCGHRGFLKWTTHTHTHTAMLHVTFHYVRSSNNFVWKHTITVTLGMWLTTIGEWFAIAYTCFSWMCASSLSSPFM